MLGDARDAEECGSQKEVFSHEQASCEVVAALARCLARNHCG